MKTAAAQPPSGGPWRIAMVSDFFLPRFGGVEIHIWSLAQSLMKMGHHVVVITHSYEDRVGVKVMSNGLRVYHLPLPSFIQDISLPALFVSLPLVREVFIRERIQIVHGHQATSTLSHEAMMHAKVMGGIRTVFTEHSLYGFADVPAIHLNKVCKFSLSNVDMCIGVSQACRANLILRASLDPARVQAIPNAVEAAMFTPNEALRDPAPRVNVVVLSRLAHRKGIDLVARVIPLACSRFPQVHFIIGGGGPKRLILDEMIERYDLQDRVELLGEVPHAQVRDVLCRGSIFLNCSLTEAFCIAILEAACCGLVVVSTDVGGIQEVLDADMIRFPDPKAPSVVEGLVDALGEVLELKVDPQDFHARLATKYNWASVAQETVDKVYAPLMRHPTHPPSFLEVLERYRGAGPFHGLMGAWAVAFDALFVRILDYFRPASVILESAPPERPK